MVGVSDIQITRVYPERKATVIPVTHKGYQWITMYMVLKPLPIKIDLEAVDEVVKEINNAGLTVLIR